MNDATKEKSGGPSQRPRSPRVPVDFTVELEGRNIKGELFKVQARAIKVSRGGATLVTDVPLAIGSLVQVTPPFASPLEAEVNGIWAEEAEQMPCIGIKLLHANGWFAE